MRIPYIGREARGRNIGSTECRAVDNRPREEAARARLLALSLVCARVHVDCLRSHNRRTRKWNIIARRNGKVKGREREEGREGRRVDGWIGGWMDGCIDGWKGDVNCVRAWCTGLELNGLTSR